MERRPLYRSAFGARGALLQLAYRCSGTRNSRSGADDTQSIWCRGTITHDWKGFASRIARSNSMKLGKAIIGILALGLPLAGLCEPSQAGGGRLIVLGVDGMDPILLRQFMA